MRSRAVNNDQSRLDDKELNNDIEEAEIDAPGSSRQNSIIPIVTFLHAYPLELLLPQSDFHGKIFLRKKFHTFYFRNWYLPDISSRHTARQTVLDTFLGEGVSKKKYCTSSSSKCKCVPRAAKDIQRGKGNINAFESCEGDDIERW